MTTAATALGLCVIAAPATAAQAYLECVFKDGQGDDFPVQLTVDEDAGSVTMLLPRTGFNQRLTGIFRPTEVLFGDRDISYKLDRVTLEITRTINLLRSSDTTRCQLLKVPQRAF